MRENLHMLKRAKNAIFDAQQKYESKTYDSVVELSQKTVEYSLKQIFVSYGQPYPEKHDVSKDLWSLEESTIKNGDKPFKWFKRSAKDRYLIISPALNNWIGLARYGASRGGPKRAVAFFGQKEADLSLQWAKEIFESVNELLRRQLLDLGKLKGRIKLSMILKKRIADKLNKSGEWVCVYSQPIKNKTADLIANSNKHYKNVYVNCVNTASSSYSIKKETILDLVKKGFVAGAEVYIAINWRKFKDVKDGRKSKLCFYPIEFLSKQFDGNDKKSVTFKPSDYHLIFEEVFGFLGNRLDKRPIKL